MMQNPFDEPASVKMSRKLIEMARGGNANAEQFLRDLVSTAAERASVEEICRACECFMQYRMEEEQRHRNQN